MARVITEQHKIALQKGRDKALVNRRKAALARVKRYRAWLAKDAPIWSAYNNGFITRDEWLKQRPSMPETPSDADYRLARGEDA